MFQEGTGGAERFWIRFWGGKVLQKLSDEVQGRSWGRF